MTSYHDIPCINCVCVPICRHKSYHNLYQDCKLLADYLQETLRNTSNDWDEENPTVFESLKEVLKPTGWGTSKSGNVDPRNWSRK